MWSPTSIAMAAPPTLDAVTADDSPEEPVIGGQVRARRQGEKVERSEEPDEEAPVFDNRRLRGGDRGRGPTDLYKQAIEVVLRDQKASTSYIQRGSNRLHRAASIMERWRSRASSARPTMPASATSWSPGPHASSGMYEDE